MVQPARGRTRQRRWRVDGDVGPGRVVMRVTVPIVRRRADRGRGRDVIRALGAMREWKNALQPVSCPGLGPDEVSRRPVERCLSRCCIEASWHVALGAARRTDGVVDPRRRRCAAAWVRPGLRLTRRDGAPVIHLTPGHGLANRAEVSAPPDRPGSRRHEPRPQHDGQGARRRPVGQHGYRRRRAWSWSASAATSPWPGAVPTVAGSWQGSSPESPPSGSDRGRWAGGPWLVCGTGRVEASTGTTSSTRRPGRHQAEAVWRTVSVRTAGQLHFDANVALDRRRRGARRRRLARRPPGLPARRASPTLKVHVKMGDGSPKRAWTASGVRGARLGDHQPGACSRSCSASSPR